MAFADVIMLGVLSQGDYSVLSVWALNVIASVLREAKGDPIRQKRRRHRDQGASISFTINQGRLAAPGSQKKQGVDSPEGAGAFCNIHFGPVQVFSESLTIRTRRE